ITAYLGEPGLGRRDLQLWWLTRSEWEGLIDVAGLEVEALYGWFDKRPFDDESAEFVWVARKA
ncbi:MAG: methyltransferase protein, partial [Gaiellaceae bacterium]|nr:methyltransferase protein [Gaiellaceae bacterium]